MLNSYETQDHNQNSHPDTVGIPQFCIFPFDFCILKLTFGQFELQGVLFMLHAPPDTITSTAIVKRVLPPEIGSAGGFGF